MEPWRDLPDGEITRRRRRASEAECETRGGLGERGAEGRYFSATNAGALLLLTSQQIGRAHV